MNYIEAYCSNKGISKEAAAEMLASPLAIAIKDWVSKSKSVGEAEILRNYDTNQVHTLRGELRMLIGMESLFIDLTNYSQGKSSEPVAESSGANYTDPLFEIFKQQINIR